MVSNKCFVLCLHRPCILVFDSLRIGSRSKVVATLREYLECEYHEKIGKDRVFSNETFPGCSPRVPQQPNFYDCGIFVLQYVESFFKVCLYCSVFSTFRFIIHSFISKWWTHQNNTMKSRYPEFWITKPQILCFVNRENSIRNIGGLVIRKCKVIPVFCPDIETHDRRLIIRIA